jgi:hypothetical protein
MEFDTENKKELKTAEDARQQAIDWQIWKSNNSMSWEEVSRWSNHFTQTAKKFELTDEFSENGII